MNKQLIVLTSSLLVLGGLAITPVALAQDITYKFSCPNVLNNLNSFISGIGNERLNSKPSQKIEFTGKVPTGTPLNLSSYYSTFIKYNAATGVVTCQFMSNIGAPTLTASYTSNAVNGTVVKETSCQVSIKVPVGLASN